MTATVDATYYDRPAIKEPVWAPSVPAYFYVGGVAGASAVLGCVAQLVEPARLHRLVNRTRVISLAGSLLGTALLVHDLGRRSRLLNMLRVFRPTSPLSVGSWVLASHTALSAVAVIGPGVLADTAALAGGITGLPIAGYTAVLISDTAIPVWQGSRRALPCLFVASSASGAASLLELTGTGEEGDGVVRLFGLVSKAGELGAEMAVEKEAGVVAAVGTAYREGVPGALLKLSRATALASLALSVLPRRSARTRRCAGVLGTVASVAVKFGVFRAGFTSARDPRATFLQQREGTGAAEATG